MKTKKISQALSPGGPATRVSAGKASGPSYTVTSDAPRVVTRANHGPGQLSAEIKFRAYQKPIFLDRTSGILILHWSRQIGKSFTLASWSGDRLLT